jgi:hypothetical protein
MPFLLKAVAGALAQMPTLKASLAADGEGLVLKHYTHIGVAVDTPNGLVVPVLRDVDKKGVFDLARELMELSGKARDGKLLPGDMQGGVFSISSLGGIGGTAFTPIVNAPEVAILGVSRSEMKPVWNGRSSPRLMLPLSLSYDHRVVDGADGVRFTTPALQPARRHPAVVAESLFGKPELSGIMRVAALAIPCLSLATLHAFALQGLKHITKSVLILNVTIPVTATALIVLMWPQSGNEVAWYLVAASLATLLLSWYWWRAVAPAAVAATPPNARELRASCLPMLVGVVVSQLIAWSGQIMLGVWGDSADVAVFNAAQRTTATMAILVASVNSILAPKFASSYAGRYDLSMQRITRSGTTLLVLAATLPAVGFLVAAEHILAVFGAEFAHGALALRVLTVGYFLHVAAGAQGYLLAMTGHEREVRNSVLMAAATSITLGLVLVPTWHLLGAALSTAVGVALQNLFCAWFAWRRLIVPARLSTDR